jgi:hypothetical protein
MHCRPRGEVCPNPRMISERLEHGRSGENADRKRLMTCARPLGTNASAMCIYALACYSLFAIRDGTPNVVRHTWASVVMP